MTRSKLAIGFTAAFALIGLVALAEDKKDDKGTGDMTIYQFTMKDIDGKDVSLSKYKGDVVLIVNVASL